MSGASLGSRLSVCLHKSNHTTPHHYFPSPRPTSFDSLPLFSAFYAPVTKTLDQSTSTQNRTISGFAYVSLSFRELTVPNSIQKAKRNANSTCTVLQAKIAMVERMDDASVLLWLSRVFWSLGLPRSRLGFESLRTRDLCGISPCRLFLRTN